MAGIDERALDEAVRRFPYLLDLARAQGFGDGPVPGTIWVSTISDVARDLIIREYHLVVAERDRAATLRLR